MRDPRPHDLVRVTDRGDPPDGWLRPAHPGTGATCPPVRSGNPGDGERTVWAVVRRARVGAGQVGLGFRGLTRSERLGVIVEATDVRQVVVPEDLVAHAGEPTAHLRALPPHRALLTVAPILDEVVPGSWGPTGSVGFELGTGLPAATASSDLDLLIRAPRPLALEDIRRMMERMTDVAGERGVRLDVQIDTGLGGFAVGEWIRTGVAVILRTSDGPRLVVDPWEGRGRCR